MRTRKRKKTGRNDGDVSEAKKVHRTVEEGSSGNVSALVANRGGSIDASYSTISMTVSPQRPSDDGPEAVRRNIEELKKALKKEVAHQFAVNKDFVHLIKKLSYERNVKLFLLHEFHVDLSEMTSPKDPLFKYRNGATSSYGRELDYENYLHDIKHSKTNRIMFIGQAGSGKCFMMRRLCRDLFEHNEELLVFCMSFTDFPDDSKEITPSEFLINGRLHDSARESCYKWMIQHQEQVVLVLHKLERARWSLDHQAKKIYDNTKGKPSEIMSNIFMKTLLPNIKVVCFSREHAVVSLADPLRFEKVVALNGFSLDDSQSLFESFGKSSGCMMSWEILKMQFPSLIPLLSIPAFLIMFSAYVYDEKYANQPKSVTSLMQNLLRFFLRSRHITVKDDEIIGILENVAFFSTSNKQPLLRIDDLKKTFNKKAGKDKKAFNIKTFWDFMIMVPIRDMRNNFLLPADSRFLFPHGIIRDFLSARYILEMDLDHFKKAVSQLLKNEDDQSSVTRFLSGLLLNDEVSVDVHKVADVEQEKKDTFKRMLTKEYGSSHFVSIKLLGTVAESNHKDFIRDTVNSLRLENMTLGDSDIHTIASVVRHLEHLNELTLVNCNFTSESLRILWNSMMHSPLKISRLDVSGNHLDEDVAAILGDIAKQCSVEEITVSGNMLNGGSLEILRASGAKISLLDGTRQSLGSVFVKSVVDWCYTIYDSLTGKNQRNTSRTSNATH